VRAWEEQLKNRVLRGIKMQIICAGCERPINIPDEKLPKGKAFMVTCPACKTKVRVDPQPEEPVSAEWEDEDDHLDMPGQVLDTDYSMGDDEDEDLVIYDETDRLALVLDDKNKEIWAKTLAEYHPTWGSLNIHLAQEEGFKVQTAKSPGHAVHKIKFTQFNLVALHENYCNVPFEKSPVYKALIEMQMSQRRNIFVVLTGAKFKTLNNMQAFGHSVNLVVNEKDLDKLPQILKKSIRENEIFYKIFRETLNSAGKS